VRHGAKEIVQLEIMPEPPEKENKLLTWPELAADAHLVALAWQDPTEVSSKRNIVGCGQISDLARVFADPARRNQYLRMYGNICYDSRDQYVNFPWSSER
jgi:hypothetical protein